jgi:hypothetical protein
MTTTTAITEMNDTPITFHVFESPELEPAAVAAAVLVASEV